MGPNLPDQDLDVFELFSGCGELSQQCRYWPEYFRYFWFKKTVLWFLKQGSISKRWIHDHNPMTRCEPVQGDAGFDVRRSDIQKGVLHDITTPEGFLLAVKGVLRCRHNALLWLGVPCSRILISISLVGFDLDPDRLSILTMHNFCFFSRSSHESPPPSSKLGLDILFHNETTFGAGHYGWWVCPIRNGWQHHCRSRCPSSHAGGGTGGLLVWTLAYDLSWCTCLMIHIYIYIYKNTKWILNTSDANPRLDLGNSYLKPT